MKEDKIKYILIRGTSAIIDIILFLIIMKLLSYYIGTKDADGYYYTNTGIGILQYYIIQLSQEIFFGKTIGKRFFKLGLYLEDEKAFFGTNRVLRIIIRRLFDLVDFLCPFFYIGFIFFSKKNQKLGDYISKMIVK
ncbi:MAG TPA: RDD family protein [Flavobacterium sp.]|nr:RDD family protein [Flavobacterium sp.]